MHPVQEFVILLAGFLIVVVAANQIARLFQMIKLPIITGLLITGIAAGPFIFRLIPVESKSSLYFINEISLAYIAFAASGELYLKELRSRFKSIKWMTFGQLAVTFIMSSVIVYFLADYVSFMKDMSPSAKIAVSILAGTIFVARSPASAIAVINEMRAKGPFTQTALGVTVLKDFLVIVLFALNLSIAVTLVKGGTLSFAFVLVLVGELLLSFGIGYLLFQILKLILQLRIHRYAKAIYILAVGYGVYLLSHFVRDSTLEYVNNGVHLEPLLICIIGSFILSNYSKYRYEFLSIINEISPVIYALFFTLVGASISLDILFSMWGIAIVLFLVRLSSMVIGSYVGGTLAGDPPLFNRIGWMPYVTQAGVGLGLATVVAQTFPEWGNTFATMVISVIVLNQIIGPPLFKWSITMVNEGRQRAQSAAYEGVRDAIIFGLENQSVALAKQLGDHGWEVKIATLRTDVNMEDYPGLDIRIIEDLTKETFDNLEASETEAIVTMLTDNENLKICELAYEEYGTKDMIVRLNHHYNMQNFSDLGCLIVDPSTAIVSLMDHFVRSPQAASLLLGMQEGQDTIEIEVSDSNMHGIPLRDLHLPQDIIILSIKRRGQMIITHGYTRLRMGDLITAVGSDQSLSNMILKFEKKPSRSPGL